MLIPIALAVAATLFLTILALNLVSGEKQIRFELDHRFAVSDPQFVRSMEHLLGSAIYDGNSVTALHNGDEIFPAMLEAIQNAKVSVTFETYIYWCGEIGKKFSEALCAWARAGAKVHVLLDWSGTKIEQK